MSQPLPAAPPTAPPGLTVGGYTLLARLGEGGMGVVHLARREPDGPRLALKVIRPHIVGDDEARSRLAREIGSLARIRSHRVAGIIDADPWCEIPYIATRYVPGLSLHEHVQAEGPVVGADLHWLAQCLAEALEAVHTADVLHRDVKPSNVLMEGRSPVLIDFGLARVADDPRLTHTGWLLGTPGYLAPEILIGADASAASDIYSWAATVAYAAIGRPPFGRGDTMAVMERVRRGEHDLDPLPAGALRSLLVDCLSTDPARRPPLGAVRARLDRLDDPTLIHRELPVAPHVPAMRELDLAPPTSPLTAAPPSVPHATTPEYVGSTAVMGDRFEAPFGTPRSSGPQDKRVLAPQPPSDARAPQPLTSQFPVQPTEHPARPSLAVRTARLVLTAALGTVAAGAAALAPWLTGAVLLVTAWLLRTGSTMGSARRDRREARGPRWYDGLQTAVGAPWHLIATLGGTIVLTLWSAGVALAAALLCFALATTAPVTLGAVGGAFALGLWCGPGSSRVRRPLQRVLHPVAGRPVPWLLTTMVMLACAGTLATYSLSGGPFWFPASGPPFMDLFGWWPPR